jgi:hypothetical protein
MNLRSGTLCVASALATVVLLAPSASAQAGYPAPAPVAIHAIVTDAPFAGVWTADGATTDSGSYLRTDAHLTGSFFRSPTTAAFQATFVFTGALGTITIQFELSFTGTDLTGVWQIAEGTGIYADAHGHGTSSFTPPDQLELRGVLQCPYC